LKRRPPAHDRTWLGADVPLPEPKIPVSIRLDRDVVEWFKAHGPRYQSRMNAVLKAYMHARKKERR
jgi:uncharacterized protein (DUF4415 family)